MATVEVTELNLHNVREIKQAAEVYELAFAQPPWKENWPIPSVVNLIKNWKALQERASGKIFAAKIDGKIVGVAFGHISKAQEHAPAMNRKLGKGKRYLLRELAVHPEFRRRGVAKALTNARLEHARQLGCVTVLGGTPAENHARIRQFEQDGFTEFHREPVGTSNGTVEWVHFKKQLTTAPAAQRLEA